MNRHWYSHSFRWYIQDLAHFGWLWFRDGYAESGASHKKAFFTQLTTGCPF